MPVRWSLRTWWRLLDTPSARLRYRHLVVLEAAGLTPTAATRLADALSLDAEAGFQVRRLYVRMLRCPHVAAWTNRHGLYRVQIGYPLESNLAFLRAVNEKLRLARAHPAPVYARLRAGDRTWMLILN